MLVRNHPGKQYRVLGNRMLSKVPHVERPKASGTTKEDPTWNGDNDMKTQKRAGPAAQPGRCSYQAELLRNQTVCVPTKTNEVIHLIHNHHDSQTPAYKSAILATSLNRMLRNGEPSQNVSLHLVSRLVHPPTQMNACTCTEILAPNICAEGYTLLRSQPQRPRT